MKPEFVSDQIIKSILYDKEDVFIPRIYSLIVSIKYFVSSKTYDNLGDSLGASSLVDNFISWENPYKAEGA